MHFFPASFIFCSFDRCCCCLSPLMCSKWTMFFPSFLFHWNIAIRLKTAATTTSTKTFTVLLQFLMISDIFINSFCNYFYSLWIVLLPFTGRQFQLLICDNEWQRALLETCHYEMGKLTTQQEKGKCEKDERAREKAQRRKL